MFWVLAQNSIYGLGIDMSGADPSSMATPFNPAFAALNQSRNITLTNIVPSSGVNRLLAFGPDTPTSAVHANDPDPARIYAVTGDIFNLGFGEVVTFPDNPSISPSTWYIGAKPARIMAGRDIIYAGKPSPIPNANTTPGFILNLDPSDVSLVSAGRDISYSTACCSARAAS